MFFVLFFVVLHVSKKKMDMGVCGWGVANPPYSQVDPRAERIKQMIMVVDP